MKMKGEWRMGYVIVALLVLLVGAFFWRMHKQDAGIVENWPIEFDGKMYRVVEPVDYRGSYRCVAFETPSLDSARAWRENKVSEIVGYRVAKDAWRVIE